MNLKDIAENKILKMSAQAGLIVVIIAILTLEATSIIQYFYTQESIKREASLRAQSELKSAQNRILDIVDMAESAVRNNLWIAQWCLNVPDSLMRVPQRLVKDNPIVVGSTIALVPGYSKKYPLYAPYVARDMNSGEQHLLSLATEEYDYPSQEWFTQPLALKEGYWSEPYYDEGGGNMLMTTFSMPVFDRNGEVAAILTADISLDWLTELMGSIKVYPNAFNTVISRTGKIMACPDSQLVMKNSIDAFAAESTDVEALKDVSEAMISGKTGETPIDYRGEKYRDHYTPVERTGWYISIVVPEKDMFATIKKVGLLVKILQIIGVLLIIITLRIVAKNQLKYKKLNAQKELIQNELRIGRDIQMSMIPKTFPAFPDRTDLDFAACLVPAKEVGGDLYDFYIRDEKLFFCIGDVSGKGVPAALVMSVTQSLFRAISAHETSPAKIVSSMNDSLSENNENNMFVTFFCGVLDMTSGVLRYSNAGHNPPMLLGHNDTQANTANIINELPVEPNLPLGVMPGVPFKEQEATLHYDDTLFLYTDGLTEAENAHAEQYGEERMKAVLAQKCDSQTLLDAMRQSVNTFVANAPQSDDLTVLVIHYLAHPTPAAQERHLILHNDIQQIPQLADFVETIADEKRLSQNLAMSLNLALEEAVTNVILYAYPDGADGLVDIEAILKEHTLEFIITDSGIPFDPTAAPDADVNLSAEERPIGGLGIYLVRQLMDEVKYHRIDGKNILSMTKNI